MGCRGRGAEGRCKRTEQDADQRRGGDVNGDFDGVPASQLAVFPGTSHFFGLARTDLVRDVVITFLDAPPPQGFGDL